MKFKRHLNNEDSLYPQMAFPLAGVILQLLIFFMLLSSFSFPAGIKVKLPKAVTSDVLSEKGVIISITRENIIYLGGEVATIKELQEKLKKSSKANLPILIKADRRASLGRLVAVWDTCREAGIASINIAVNRGE